MENAMPEKSIVFEGKLPNGVCYKVHNAQGFTKTHAELAVEISGQFVVIVAVVQKRSGSTEIIPTMGNRMTIRPDGAMQEEATEPVQTAQIQDPEQSKPSDLLSGI
jgi:hypothetical protein